MKAVVAAFNQEKALVGAFSVITNLRMELFEALARGGALQVQPRPVLLQQLHDAVLTLLSSIHDRGHLEYWIHGVNIQTSLQKFCYDVIISMVNGVSKTCPTKFIHIVYVSPIFDELYNIF